jgi:hypothetical protein
MPADKPRARSGYTREETELAKSALLSVAVTLGAYMDDLCVVGGLAPLLLIDLRQEPGAALGHPGTLDLDVGLALALLDERRYAEVSARLRREKFGPRENRQGNPSLQCWTDARKRVTVDFLLPPTDASARPGRIQRLESDFGALVTRGLELAFDERLSVPLLGRTLRGERADRSVPVCGPAAFIVLKALAFGDRGEPKDAFDLVYVLQRWPAGIDDVADRLQRHATRHEPVVRDALAILERDFEAIDTVGPARVVEFEGAVDEAVEEIAADARGAVDDLLYAYSRNPDRPTDAAPAGPRQSAA